MLSFPDLIGESMDPPVKPEDDIVGEDDIGVVNSDQL